jgi:mRNA-degrading endonuclease RelE of RelBE toxin-antitoxin system
MPRPTCQPVEIIATASFQRDIANFRKQHPSIDQAIVDVLADEVGPDPTSGWAIPGWASKVYKLRVANKEGGSGKRGGFRLIYEWHPDERILWLLRIYTHNQVDDISAKEIRKARDAAGI